MNRARKKEISLNKDSVLGLMQEIYNEGKNNQGKRLIKNDKSC